MNDVICDFCSSTSVRWLYPCEAFILPEHSFRSTDAWASCGVCSELIENNDRKGLEERSVEVVLGMVRGNDFSFMEEFEKAYRKFVKDLHTKFFELRKEREPAPQGLKPGRVWVEYTN